jgi:antitoxin PrlF
MGQITKLTSKHQTTIPADVRLALGLKAGDSVNFEITDGQVTLRRVSGKLSDEQLFALSQSHVMRDWDTPEDDAAFRHL